MDYEIQLLIAFFVSLVGAAILLGLTVWDRKYTLPFTQYMVALTILLNLRYFTAGGPPKGIAFFVGIYDILHNYASNDVNATVAMVPFMEDDQDCSILSLYYTHHASWSVIFHHRFQFAPYWRTQALLVHVAGNTIAFCLMTLQLYFPGRIVPTGTETTTNHQHALQNQRHRILGRVANLCLVVGIIGAVLLALEHGDIGHYGGKWSTFGFLFMAMCVLGPLGMGMTAILKTPRNISQHAQWMFRATGSFWGTFWVFRAMELLLGPLLTHFEALSIQLCIWCSSPIGLIIAEAILRKRGGAQFLQEGPTSSKGGAPRVKQA